MKKRQDSTHQKNELCTSIANIILKFPQDVNFCLIFNLIIILPIVGIFEFEFKIYQIHFVFKYFTGFAKDWKIYFSQDKTKFCAKFIVCKTFFLWFFGINALTWEECANSKRKPLRAIIKSMVGSNRRYIVICSCASFDNLNVWV